MLNRRRFFAVCTAAGLGGTLFPGVLWGLAQGKEKITPAMLDEASAIADVPVPADVREMMLANLETQREGYEEIYQLHMPNSAVPALDFDPVLPGMKFETTRRPMRISENVPGTAAAPKNLEDIAFYSVRQLAELVRTRKVTSLALTEMYLGRLKRYDKSLHFVINLTEERGHRPSQARGRGNRRRKIPRATAWTALGRQRSAGGERLSDHLGRRWVRAADV